MTYTAPQPTAAKIARSVSSREVSAYDIVRGAIDRASAASSLNIFTTLFTEAAPRIAVDIDARIAAGEHLPLAGVPIAVKDNICIGPHLYHDGDRRGYGGPTTCASRFLENYHSPYTATAVQRLINAGAVVLGKTNMDEFGMGSSTEHSIFGATRNPHDVTRVAGGSSGGSAAAVAAGICPVALGSDTGGSIRQPASHCGVVGFKPTYGRVSRYGLVAYASSLDQIGTLTTNASDAALVASIMSGEDPHDSTTARHVTPIAAAVAPMPAPHSNQTASPLRVGVPQQAFHAANHPDVTRILNETIQRLRACGVEIVDVQLPMTDYGIAAYYIVAAAEASSNLARFDGVRFGSRAHPLAETETQPDIDSFYRANRTAGFGLEVQKRIMLGTYVLSSGYYNAYYNRACRVRQLIINDYHTIFGAMGCHAVLMPASPGPAFKLGEKADDPLAMYLEDVYTVGVNLAGLPAIAVPAGAAPNEGLQLPIGMQLVAPAMREDHLFTLATALSAAAQS